MGSLLACFLVATTTRKKQFLNLEFLFCREFSGREQIISAQRVNVMEARRYAPHDDLPSKGPCGATVPVF